jgi:hypothetical protein
VEKGAFEYRGICGFVRLSVHVGAGGTYWRGVWGAFGGSWSDSWGGVLKGDVRISQGFQDEGLVSEGWGFLARWFFWRGVEVGRMAALGCLLGCLRRVLRCAA